MIVTLTLNPSVDRTVVVDALPRGAVIRSRRAWSEPSGKGVNVALALHRHGLPATAVLPVGGAVGAQLSDMLGRMELPVRVVTIRDEIRSNISLVEPDGTVTKVNEPGPELGADETEALVRTVLDNLAGAAWLACCGSLPVGVPVEVYARLARAARDRGVRVAVDTSGEPLRASLAGRPDLVAPNADELADLVGRPLRTLGEVVDAAREVRALGADAVLASLGADGALLVDAEVALYAEAPAARVVSAVGAGDAALAGFLHGGGRGAPALRTAVAWGTAAVQHGGTLFPAAAEPDQTALLLRDDFDPTRPLRDPAAAGR
ncbi:1-phosphofructokinase [Plantactinospora sp. S1510]|uniref:1-phosphofructokinase n=1 Tax=Plantactinospora alkalitolerans TaxID=2789879 RepID=A0ABS0GMY2_9ACTN|nr:1-phosphofructokinase [Plantactinospora alkalitolerans]MBF9127550.1 1-phosphofructokinase [Plantactinospora alkalitolerans]